MFEYIQNYLDNHYSVTLNGYILNHTPSLIEEGKDVVKFLTKTFSISEEEVIEIFHAWNIKHGISDEEYESLYNIKPLRVTWSPELANDLTTFQGFDAETELIAILSEHIANEIDAQILRDLNGNLNTDEFISVVRCLGYQLGPTIYNPTTFQPRRNFIPLSLQERKNERQNNTIWQNWVRTREQNQET